MELTPPNGSGGSLWATYLVVGAKLRTNALVEARGCQEPSGGSYRWQLSGDRLRFGLIGDRCEARRSLFSVTWQRLG